MTSLRLKNTFPKPLGLTLSNPSLSFWFYFHIAGYQLMPLLANISFHIAEQLENTLTRFVWQHRCMWGITGAFIWCYFNLIDILQHLFVSHFLSECLLCFPRPNPPYSRPGPPWSKLTQRHWTSAPKCNCMGFCGRDLSGGPQQSGPAGNFVP